MSVGASHPNSSNTDWFAYGQSPLCWYMMGCSSVADSCLAESLVRGVRGLHTYKGVMAGITALLGIFVGRPPRVAGETSVEGASHIVQVVQHPSICL
jgi:hypothetical protein